MISRTPRITPRTAPRTAVALVAGIVALSTIAPAHAAGSPDGPVNASATLEVTGNGWGHGHGMSQWGAQGAALEGLSYPQILAFYYPGTTLSSLGGKVEVLITANIRHNLKVKSAPGIKVIDLGRHKKYRLPSARAWKLKSVKGHTRVYRKTGRWHRYRPGGHPYLAGDGQFKSGSHLLALKLPSGNRIYRGKLRFTHLRTVNVVSLEKYLRGVVPAEVYTSWKPAALQAQAVAARSYAGYERAHSTTYYDVYDTTRSQAYAGYDIEDPHTDAAIAATAGRILSHGGQPAFTQFSASSGGATSAGGFPYLTAHSDPYDAAVSPYIHWTKTVDTAKLEAAHPEIGTLQSLQIVTREGPAGTEWGGYVDKVALNGSVQDLEIDGDEFRSLYGLRSSFFAFNQ